MALRAFAQLGLQAVEGTAQHARLFASAITVKPDWKAAKLPEETVKNIPTATGGAAFPGDLRSTSGLGLGDGLKTHTAKWLQVRAQQLHASYHVRACVAGTLLHAHACMHMHVPFCPG